MLTSKAEMSQLTLDQFERIVDSWSFPWPQYLYVIKKELADALERAGTDEDKNRAKNEYGQKITRLLEEASKNTAR